MKEARIIRGCNICFLKLYFENNYTHIFLIWYWRLLSFMSFFILADFKIFLKAYFCFELSPGPFSFKRFATRESIIAIGNLFLCPTKLTHFPEIRWFQEVSGCFFQEDFFTCSQTWIWKGQHFPSSVNIYIQREGERQIDDR